MTAPQMSANVTPGPAWALLSPFGRMGREPYWLCLGLILVLAIILINLWFSSMGESFSQTLATGTQSPETLDLEALRTQASENAESLNDNPLFFISFFVLELFQLAILIKRLQDIGQSGFFALLIFVPVLGFLMQMYLGFAPSEAQPNRHGPLPNSYWRRA